MAAPLPFAGTDDVLAAMITPAVLISASGTMVLSTSNRLGRIVDRVRKLSAEVDDLSDDNSPRAAAARAWIGEQLHRLARRIRYLQNALAALYLALGLLVGCSLAIGVRGVTKAVHDGVPVGLGLAGASALFVASLLLFRESRLAVRTTLLEINHVRAAIARAPKRPDG